MSPQRDLDGKEEPASEEQREEHFRQQEELIQKSGGGNELSMFQGWRPGQCGWYELRTAVAGSEAGDAGRVLVT